MRSDGKVLATTVQAVVASGDTVYDVPLPLGAYHVAVLVDSDVTGTTTAVGVAALCNEARSQAAAAFQMSEAGTSSVAAALTLTASDEGRYAAIVPTGVATPGPIALANGLRVSVTKGTAVAGQKCAVTVVAAKVA